MKVKYPTRDKHKGSRTFKEYFYKKRWGTIADHAERFNRSSHGIAASIRAGVPMEVGTLNYYVVDGPHKGEWLANHEITHLTGRPKHWIIKHKVMVDGIKTIDLSIPFEPPARKQSSGPHIIPRTRNEIIARETGFMDGFRGEPAKYLMQPKAREQYSYGYEQGVKRGQDYTGDAFDGVFALMDEASKLASAFDRCAVDGAKSPPPEPCATCMWIKYCKETQTTCSAFRSYCSGRGGAMSRVPDKDWDESFPISDDEKVAA